MSFLNNPAFTDNGVPIGAITPVDIMRGPKASAVKIVAGAILEHWTFTPNTNRILRPDQSGGPNGFQLITGQPSASGTIQIPTSATETPKDGDWFSYVRDKPTAQPPGAAEVWVLHNIGDVWDFTTYRKVSAQASQAFSQP